MATRQTRARDSDRTATCEVLDSALAEGQLSMEEHRQRVSSATSATTLGELQSLVADLQPVNPVHPPVRQPSRLSGRRSAWAAIAGLQLVLSVAIGWGLWGNSSSPSNTTSSSPAAETPETAVVPADSPAETEHAVLPDEVPPIVVTPPQQLHSAQGLAGVLDEIRKRFGDTMGIELAITPDEALLFRPDPTDDQAKLFYRFNGGWGDPTRKPRDDKDTPADLGAFDVNAIAEVLRGAPEVLGIAPADVSTTFLDVDHIKDPPGPGALELLVKVDRKSGGSGFIYLDSAGNTKRVEYPV